MHGAQDRRADGCGGRHPVAAEVVFEVQATEPRVGRNAWGQRPAVVGGDGRVVEEGDGRGGGEGGLDADEGAPVEGLDGGALGEAFAFEERDEVRDVALDGKGLIGPERVEFGFEVDGDALVAVAGYKVEDFFESCDFGTVVD